MYTRFVIPRFAKTTAAVCLGLLLAFCIIGADMSTVRADNCPACSKLLMRVPASKAPRNGLEKLGRVNDFDIIGVFKNGKLEDYYLENRDNGKKLFGTTEVKTLKVFSKCFEFEKFGVKLKLCITVDISV